MRKRDVIADSGGKPLRVFIACGGVGIAQRGFETLARDCFEALARRDDISVTLVKGRGRRASRERVAPTIQRDGRAAHLAARAVKRDPYWVEQVVFTGSLIPLIALRRPHVVFVSEWSVGRGLARWKRRSRARFKLLHSNGGPYPPDWLDHADHLHQLTPHELERAVEAGVPRERQTLLEIGVRLPRDERPLSPDERRAARTRLGLPPDRPVLLAVAALAFHHKRLDYLVREVAALPEPRPHLVMLGQREPETPELIKLATSLLGPRGFTARTVEKGKVADYYLVADVFVHTALWEAFGLVMVEALSYGLPCIVQDGPTQRFLLRDHALMGDLTTPGGLASLVPQALYAACGAERERRRAYVRDRFAWDRLAPRYVRMMHAAAGRAHG